MFIIYIIIFAEQLEELSIFKVCSILEFFIGFNIINSLKKTVISFDDVVKMHT